MTPASHPLARIAERLAAERPRPEPSFTERLRRRLLAESPTPPGRVRALVVTYVGLGSVLLALAVLGTLGLGPFAA